jgi:hypothetical protein
MSILQLDISMDGASFMSTLSCDVYTRTSTPVYGCYSFSAAVYRLEETFQFVRALTVSENWRMLLCTPACLLGRLLAMWRDRSRDDLFEDLAIRNRSHAYLW